MVISPALGESIPRSGKDTMTVEPLENLVNSLTERIHRWIELEYRLVEVIGGLPVRTAWPQVPAIHPQLPVESSNSAFHTSTVSSNIPPANTDQPVGVRLRTCDSLRPVTERILTAIGRERLLTGTIGELREGTRPKVRSSGPTSVNPPGVAVETVPYRSTRAPDRFVDSVTFAPFDPGAGSVRQKDPPPSNPLDDLISAIYEPPTSQFDDVIAAVSESPTQRASRLGPPPPPERFRVRVAPVGRPHRTTKRNYDYFEELNTKLAARAKWDQSNNA